MIVYYTECHKTFFFPLLYALKWEITATEHRTETLLALMIEEKHKKVYGSDNV